MRERRNARATEREVRKKTLLKTDGHEKGTLIASSTLPGILLEKCENGFCRVGRLKTFPFATRLARVIVHIPDPYISCPSRGA